MGRFNPPRDAIRQRDLITPSLVDGYPLVWFMLQGHVRVLRLIGSITSGFNDFFVVRDDVAIQDVALEAWVPVFTRVARVNNLDDFPSGDAYLVGHDGGTDFNASRVVSGAFTTIGTETVAIQDGKTLKMMGSFSSLSPTTVKGFREDFVTAKFAPTDSTAGLQGPGYVGFLQDQSPRGHGLGFNIKVRPPASRVAKIAAFLEVDVIGTGSQADPYRPDLPTMPDGVSYSALIKDDGSGSPKEFRSVVRIHEASNPDPTDLSNFIAAARTKEVSYTELTRTQAITRAKEIDDVLANYDFNDISPDEQKGWTP